jgi:hypothetical protein
MNNALPGFDPRRLLQLMQAAVTRCELDLKGAIVLTEAASGAYVVTPVLAAMAGAERVFAVTRSTRHGTVEEISDATMHLAGLAGVQDKLKISAQKLPEEIAVADIITNSGHVRPLDAPTVARMKSTAVIPLMYEAWEFRGADVDIAACRRRGIAVAGTNERHPSVGVFSYLGIMAVKQLLDCGIAVFGCRVVLLCNNAFAEFIEAGLRGVGATVCRVAHLEQALDFDSVDAVVLALHPRDEVVLTRNDAVLIAKRWPGAVVTQYWGDADRASLTEAGVPVWPPQEPSRGHMGVLPSAVGPEPIVRLQSGGLKVGELLSRARRRGDTAEAAVTASIIANYGQAIERN